jgi:protein-S-isoprenylcysteine O-methyltransferase Ste14
VNIRNRVIQFLVKRSQKKYPVVVRALVTFLGATLFWIIFPLLSYGGGILFLQNEVLPVRIVNFISFISFLWGIPWMIWAILWQLTQGEGTPVPVIPTKRFLPHGPYRYVRNPMILGFSFYLLGWAFLFNRYGSLITALITVVTLFLEIKFIEEHELQQRFGNDYLDYKKEVPFLIPKYRKS